MFPLLNHKTQLRVYYVQNGSESCNNIYSHKVLGNLAKVDDVYSSKSPVILNDLKSNEVI